MTVTNGYCTLQELKDRQAITGTDATRDAYLEDMIEASSRWIDGHTGRRFYAASETRYFSGQYFDLLFVDDLLSVTTLKTDEDGDRTYEITWATTDYDLEPYNATVANPPGPYTMIRISPSGNYIFPYVRKGVQIVGSFGYSSSAPHDIREACLLLSARFWKRKDTILGVSANTQLGQLTIKVPEDKDILALLEPFKRLV
jgi:hypothetical protein